MNSRSDSIREVSREARSSQPNDNSSQGKPAVGNEDEVELEYLSGVNLALVILAVIAIALLVMLDMSIIATVSGLPLAGSPKYVIN